MAVVMSVMVVEVWGETRGGQVVMLTSRVAGVERAEESKVGKDV